MATGDAAADKSIRRRRVLIGVSDTLRLKSPAPQVDVLRHPLVGHLSGAEAEVKEFVTRRVLVGDDDYLFKVPLFHSWLDSRGVTDIITSFDELDAASRARQEEGHLQVRSDEIVKLVGAWPPYRGQIITEDKIRAWLAQFGGVKEQRSMFTLLKHVRFYSNGFVRSKMAE